MHINSKVNQLPFFSNISQILLLYKTWGYYNKFDSMKSVGIYKVVVTDVSKYLVQRGDMEHGLEYITFYVKKHMAYLAVCSGPLPVRD